MTVTNELIIKCLNDLFVLWRAGNIMSAEAIGHAQYVVGGYLLLTSGHGGGPRMAGGDLQSAVAADTDLSKSIEEFIAKEAPPVGRSVVSGDLLARLAFVVEILMTYILRYLKGV